MVKRVLLVDDDLYIRELYEEVLKNAGYDVTTAVDGVDGIAKLKEQSFDLIFLDMIMPKVDGMGVLRELSQNPPAEKNGPIVLFSNLGSEQVNEEAKQNGVIETLVKAEITPDQLVACANKYLGE